MKLLKRTVPLWLMLLLLIATSVGITFALEYEALTIQKINLFGGQYQSTQFTIAGWETKIKGKNKVEITVSVRNTGATANMTLDIQLLNSSGDIINIAGTDMEYSITASIPADTTKIYKNTFTGSGLVALYSTPQIVIKQ